MEKEIIKQVYKIKRSNQKLVTIPAKSDIEAGDHVRIKKVEE